MNLSTDSCCKTERISFIDTSKCILVFWVVLVHINYDFDPGSLAGWISYPYYMPAFFFISGIFHRQRPFLEQLKAKSRALLIPFCFFYAISYIWTWGFKIEAYLESGFLPNVDTLLRLAPGASYTTFNGALWFFIVLFLHSILYTPFQYWISKTYIRVVGLLCLSILGLYLWSIHIFPLAHFCYFYVFYACGAEYGRKLLSIIVHAKFLLLSILFVGLLILINNVHDFIPVLSHIPYAIRQEGAAFIFIPILLSLCYWIDRIKLLNSVLRYMGKYSIVVFAIHMPYYACLYSESMVVSGYLCKIGFFIIFCVVSAVLAIILNKYAPVLIGKK